MIATGKCGDLAAAASSERDNYCKLLKTVILGPQVNVRKIIKEYSQSPSVDANNALECSRACVDAETVSW